LSIRRNFYFVSVTSLLGVVSLIFARRKISASRVAGRDDTDETRHAPIRREDIAGTCSCDAPILNGANQADAAALLQIKSRVRLGTYKSIANNFFDVSIIYLAAQSLRWRRLDQERSKFFGSYLLMRE